MKCKKLFFTLACFLLTLLFSISQIRLNNETRAKELAPQVLRFHILANSDSRIDQKIKLEIRSLVLDYLRGRLPQSADKQSTMDWLTLHQKEIEALANHHLALQHLAYHAHFELTNCYFPTRYYNGTIFPCGAYDAARITLGNGSGHNWWCVLYPRSCFVDEVSETKSRDETPLSKDPRPVLKFRIKLISLLNPH